MRLTYDSQASEPKSEFMARFETEWTRLQSLTTGSNDPYCNKFREFLEEDKAKRYFLLGFLVDHYDKVVDNLTTKGSLYSQFLGRATHPLYWRSRIVFRPPTAGLGMGAPWQNATSSVFSAAIQGAAGSSPLSFGAFVHVAGSL
jgi:hypothetical protein